MARNSTQGSKGRKSSSRSNSTSSRRTSGKKIDLRKFNNTDLQRVVKKIGDSPLALYLAGGVGTIFLARFAYRYYRNHPEIQEFIRENFDTVESTLREYRGGSVEESEGREARH